MTPQILFHRAALQPHLSVHIYPGLTSQMCRIQLLKHQVSDGCPVLQFVKIFLQGLCAIEGVNSSYQLSVICKLI